MKKLRLLGIIILLFIGFIILGFITGILSIPSIKGYTNNWGNISDSATEIITSITIENSNPFKITIPRVEIDYSLKMNDIKVAHGNIDKINLEKGEHTIEVTSYLNNSKISDWWVSHIKNNETTIVKIEPIVVIDAEFAEPQVETTTKTFNIETNLLENFEDLEKTTVEAGPVNLTFTPVAINWGDVSGNNTELCLAFKFYNPFPVSIPIPEINYKILMNEIKIGNGTIDDAIVLGPLNNTLVNIVTNIDNNMLDKWFVSHLQNNEQSILEIFINSTINYYENIYKIDDFSIYTHELDTDILGTGI